MILNFEVIDYKTSLHTTSKKTDAWYEQGWTTSTSALIIQEGSDIFGQDTNCLSISL